jgi:hypothetical protein
VVIMLRGATREIRQAAEAEARRRRRVERLPALVSALDALLFELEELNLRGVAMASASCRQRAADLIAETSRPVDLPESVADLMERAYQAQDAAMLRLRASGWAAETRAAPPRP